MVAVAAMTMLLLRDLTAAPASSSEPVAEPEGPEVNTSPLPALICATIKGHGPREVQYQAEGSVIACTVLVVRHKSDSSGLSRKPALLHAPAQLMHKMP